MDVFIRNIDGATAVFCVEPEQTVLSVKEKIFLEEGIDPSDQTLSHNGRPLDDWRILSEYDIAAGSTLDLTIPIRGGADFGFKFSFNHKDLNLKQLAAKYRIDKMVCRKCYARLPQDATNCRKRKCGHSSDLRPKTKPEQHDRKKN